LITGAGLLIGIIAALALIIIVGATLFLTGAFGGGSSGKRLPLTRENLVGSWSTDEDCSSHVTEFLANGEYWQENLRASGGAPMRWGTWRLDGDRSYQGSEFVSLNRKSSYRVNRLTRDAVDVTQENGEEATWPRCSRTLASGASASVVTSSTPTVTGPSAASGSADTAAGLQQAVAQFQPRLPMRKGPVTISSVSAQGSVMRMEGSMAIDMAPADWARLDTSLRPSICAGSFAQAVRSGAAPPC